MEIPHIAGDDDFAECVRACDRLLTVKGADYTQGESLSPAKDAVGRLKNFYRNGERLGLAPMQVLAVYMFKHVDAIETFLLKGKVESEAIEGRIQDAINYMLLLYKMVQHEKRRARQAQAATIVGSSTG